MRDIRVANAMQNAPEARITRVAPDVRNALLSMDYFWSVLYMYFCQEDTSLLGTPTFNPKLVISVHFDLYNQDTHISRTAVVSPLGVLNREVPLIGQLLNESMVAKT
jgi:hypothetical protein